jgi:hypothetical protein
MAQKGAIGTVNLRTRRFGNVSVGDDNYQVLLSKGFTGSSQDMKRKDWLSRLGLTEPPAVLMTNTDLEFQYLRGLGFTGSMQDMRKANGQ